MIVGANRKSSTAALEVITGIMPVRTRLKELCCCEYLRIMSLEENHVLRNMMFDSTRSGLNFSPVHFIQLMSREGCTKAVDRMFPSCPTSPVD